ncbi:MAG TPA: tRNA dihydrouridine(20/20a) synthase DusA [Thermopetrobacter sp.]|nr:tRNA dihydrouridine(20/20a) synthase DusA [Thermopetrobacter sp.]
MDTSFAVAPMMDWTDRHCRFFHRILSRRAVLYTEMVTAEAVIHGDRRRLLGFSPEEHPVVVQLGGSDPATMAEAARICAEWGYDAININVGCPSDRVRKGHFGAVLMKEPETVAACVAAMARAVDVPVTVKCRVGVDDMDTDADLDRFVDIVADAGVRTFVVHARKAWLEGLSPKENRERPPLNYARVERLKARRPDLEIILNGGLETIEDCRARLAAVDGVMVGRAAYRRPWLLAAVDPVLFGEPAPVSSPLAAMERFLPYVAARLEEGVPLHAVVRHTLGIFHGRPGARLYRRHISENAVRPGAGIEVLLTALDLVRARMARRSAAE